MKTSSPDARDFYVYGLFGADGIIRYIGKGRGRRWKHHDRETKSRNRIKNKFIRDTLAALGEIPKIKIRENLTEAEAFETEIALIKAIGRRDLGTGPLVNMSDGGTGGDFGEAVRRAKAKWGPEQRQKVSQEHSKNMKHFWSSMTDDERAALLSRTIPAAHAAMKRLQESDPEYEIRRVENIRKGHAKRTPEQKLASIEKMLASIPPGQQSEALRKFHASQTPEERSRRVKGSLTSEQLSERSRLAQAKIPPEVRSDIVRQQQASLTEEQKVRRADRARKIAENNTNSRWINDGQQRSRLKADKPLPEGWSYGYKLDRALSKRSQ